METSQLINVPNEILMYELFDKMDIPTLTTFCKLNRYYKNLCEDEDLWYRKYQQYYSSSGMIKQTTWYDLVQLFWDLSFLIDFFSLPSSIIEMYKIKSLNLSSKNLPSLPKDLPSDYTVV